MPDLLWRGPEYCLASRIASSEVPWEGLERCQSYASLLHCLEQSTQLTFEWPQVQPIRSDFKTRQQIEASQKCILSGFPWEVTPPAPVMHSDSEKWLGLPSDLRKQNF